MAILNPKDVATEETREDILAEALVGTIPGMPGVECVRGFSPLVMLALQKANNPFVTNRKGFEAIGIEFDSKGQQLTTPAEFGFAMMPKTAEVLVLFTCSREDLKQFAVSPAALEDAALELLDGLTLEQSAEAMVFIAERMKRIGKAQATKAEDDTKPVASTMPVGKKKHGPTG